MPDTTLNLENFDKLIGFLETLPDERFDQTYWANDNSCGTTACIAGWGMLIARPHLDLGKEDDRNELRENASRVAREWLGISEHVALALFIPDILDNGAEPELRDAITLLKLTRTGATSREIEDKWEELYPDNYNYEDDEDDREQEDDVEEDDGDDD